MSSTHNIINQIILLVNQKYTADQAMLINQYINQLMHSLNIEDLQQKSADEHFACFINNWLFINAPKKKSIVRVYNPELNTHGWQSNHTVVEVHVLAKPFLVDSIRLAIQRLNLNIHLIANINNLNVVRNNEYKITKIYESDDNLKISDNAMITECAIYIEIDEKINLKLQEQLINVIENVANDVNQVVEDWQSMRIKAEEALMYINKLLRYTDLTSEQIEQLDETYAFIHWLTTNHFTFLGYAEFRFEQDNDSSKLKYIKDSGLGILNKNNIQDFSSEFGQLSTQITQIYLNSDVMLLSKSTVTSKIHRAVNIDLVSIKILDENLKLMKELRFFGLYTSTVYNFNTLEIPYINKKVKTVLKLVKFSEDSHDGRTLLNVIDNMPRDDVFHSTTEELSELALNIIHMKERAKVMFMARKDLFLRYFSCFVFVPRESYDSSLRKKLQDLLLQEFHGDSITFSTNFNESILARMHFLIKINPQYSNVDFDIQSIQQKVIETAKTWSAKLLNALNIIYKNETSMELYKLFEDSFGASYQECFTPSTAVIDIGYLSKTRSGSNLEMNLYRDHDDQDNIVRLKLFGKNKPIVLSDIVPIIENMGFKVLNERPYQISTAENVYWINDYKLLSNVNDSFNIDSIKDIFLDALKAVLTDIIDNDKFNKLVLSAKQNYHDIKILRAYYKYLWQTGFSNNQDFVAETLSANPEISKKLINLFHVKFNPELADNISTKEEHVATLKESIINDLENVTILSQDKIIRSYVEVIEATVRTNFFQKDDAGVPKNYLSFKVESNKISTLPLPKPLFEIFVYAKHCEGIHLRANNIARGGIRWSDRHEDYRTEILGLMKAQQVKNAVIVPLGAKGGFIVKTNLNNLSKPEQNNVVIEAYKTLMRGLLDLTDNIVNSAIIHPKDTVFLDKDDPYLVVAADKGTAKFSDIANAISEQYNFWLGDAFASGGSQGYDHKKLSITSKGVFESVKFHFGTLGVDVDKDPITVIGIGDMAGDVFGNGMLLSKNYKLVAAFNHMHIFLDPNPDMNKSFKERSRMFNLEYSTWEDYNPKVISTGGGVFKRTDKKIKISKEVQELFNINDEFLEPNELIKVILCSKVDLLWNGGIGTFVKASTESHAMVSDHINDSIRIDGNQLRVKVVAEGGNLGFTQLGRVEYAKNGGIINTDALDNSAGVNCSDFEVNIKILLQSAIQDGILTINQRNDLLNKMQAEVVDLVLANNKSQNEAITSMAAKADKNLRMHSKLMHDLENTANLNIKVEFLPSQEEIVLRQNQGLGFTRPELCILLAYAKIQLKSKLLASKLPDEKFNEQQLFNYFPKLLHKDYSKQMLAHSLRRQVITTKLVNKIIDEMGLNFINRLVDETNASEDSIVRCYLIANRIFNVDELRSKIRNQSKDVGENQKIEMIFALNRLVRQATRWLIQHKNVNLSIEAIIEQFLPTINLIQGNLLTIIDKKQLTKHQESVQQYLSLGVSEDLANMLAKLSYMFSALDITEISITNNAEPMFVAQSYFAVGSYLSLNWFRDAILNQPVSTNWDALARSSFKDDVDRQQCVITVCVISANKKINLIGEHVADWFAMHEAAVNRWKVLINNLKASTTDFTIFAVALRELLSLASSVNYS
jgi:glutamate dehydrogenase